MKTSTSSKCGVKLAQEGWKATCRRPIGDCGACLCCWGLFGFLPYVVLEVDVKTSTSSKCGVKLAQEGWKATCRRPIGDCGACSLGFFHTSY